jgi:midasin
MLIPGCHARLQVGELGVLRFGGAGHVAPLHPLGRPFTDADGPRILSGMRFDKVCASWLKNEIHDKLNGIK